MKSQTVAELLSLSKTIPLLPALSLCGIKTMIHETTF
jgi:hypothetical protein